MLPTRPSPRAQLPAHLVPHALLLKRLRHPPVKKRGHFCRLHCKQDKERGRSGCARRQGQPPGGRSWRWWAAKGGGGYCRQSI